MLGLLVCFWPAAAPALIRLDFEQKFFIHPGQQVWDFCVVRPDSLYHIFYIEYADGVANARCLALGHATSPDLVHWTILPPSVPAGPDWWDANNVWAPEVVWDPGRGKWIMFYTGVDSLKVQRACAAYSPDLRTWTKDPGNPIFAPDSLAYHWSPTLEWSSFRDPFLFFADGVWNMLSTAGLRLGGYPGYRQGIVHRATSPDLAHWTDAGPFWVHDGGSTAWHDLESTQYVVRNGWHHLFVTEQDVFGVSHMVADTAGAWTIANRTVIDFGNAAEVDQFDPGIDVISRYMVGQHRNDQQLFYVVRFDTLRWLEDGKRPQIYKPHPLDRDFVVRSGSSTLGQPTWGDNPAERGEPSCGLVGHGWFGSQEYYQGPGSGRGSPGSRLGDTATGFCESRAFFITGAAIRLRVGGGHYPQTCYVALMDADADTILLRETGTGVDWMSERVWDVRSWRGRLAYIRIVDQETGPFGHINVDEVEELPDTAAHVGERPGAASPPLRAQGVRPNPGNPAVEIRYALDRAGAVQVLVSDARGRPIWRGPVESRPPGPGAVTWRGRDWRDRPVASGPYLYMLLLDGRPQASGKLSIVR